jgi:hypothetical protein
VKRLVFALVAVAAGIGALVLALPLRSPPVEATAGKNVFVNPPRPIDANNSPTMVRNPILPGNLVMTHRVDRPGFSAVISSSLDNGATWRVMPLPLPSTVPACSASEGTPCPFAPDLAFAPDGTLFVSYVNLEGNGNVPGAVWVARSKDGGQSLLDPVKVATGLTFQVRLAVDNENRVHLTWLQAAEVGLFRMAGGPNRIMTTHASDDGQTWSTPAPISDANRERVGAASPAVDSSGQLVVLYYDYKSDRRDFEFLDGPPAEEPFALVVTRSEDGGKTFSVGQEIDSGLVSTRRFLVFLPEFPSLSAGRDATMYAAWADGRNGDEDVFIRRSDDGGRTWRQPVRVNDNRRSDKTDQFLPRVAVAPDGRVDVLYLDRRNDPAKNIMTDAYLATSTDGGKSFKSVRMSSQSFDSRVGPVVDAKLPVDFGSRIALVSDKDTVVAAWTDSRLGTEDTGRQDIAAAAAKVAPGPPERTRLLTVIGLLALSLLGLLGWVLSGRGARGQTARTRREPSGVKDESVL